MEPEASRITSTAGSAPPSPCSTRMAPGPGGARKVVFAASSAAYGDSEVLPKHEGMTPDPLSPYASGKLAAERMLAVWGKVHGLETVALRYFNVFGPRQADDSPYTGVIALFAKSLLAGKAVTIHGDGEQSRDFTYVDNAVQANLLAMETPLPVGTVLNVGTGERISVNQLHDAMAELCGFDARAAENIAPNIVFGFLIYQRAVEAREKAEAESSQEKDDTASSTEG